jgi:hypothetical protein
MAEFAMAKIVGGAETWINLNQVRSAVSYDGKTTTVTFEKEHSIIIEGPPAVIVSGHTKGERRSL